jgi:hypothetical protein
MVFGNNESASLNKGPKTHAAREGQGLYGVMACGVDRNTGTNGLAVPSAEAAAKPYLVTCKRCRKAAGL